MAHTSAPTAQASAAGPKSAPPPLIPPPPYQTERQEQRRNLATWWNNFKRSDKKPPHEQQPQQAPRGIFGVPLQDSIRYANVAISLFDDEGQSYIYGYVPIVVAKCGVFLKEKATDVEGIFRLAGSEKRIKELKVQFDSPDRYGKGLDWTGYTVHDAANILRRYFNQLPEPIIPLDFYERFRDPLRNHQAQAVGELEAQSPSVGNFDQDAAIRTYQSLITELPPLNRQLLLYILDLLAVFASKSDLNKMTTANLSAIFQPGILSHPQHDMAPPEYRLSQDVLIFLIENQDSFLIGMQGTAADPETVREVQSGSPPKAPATPSTPSRSKTIIGRSSSNASVGAESVAKFGGIRRNLSVSSSKRSKRSEGGPTVVAGNINSPSTPTSGVHRSNTVPSRRGGSNGASPRFSREKNSDPSTPSPGNTSTVGVDSTKPRQESLQSTPIVAAAPQFPSVQSASSSEVTTPLAPVGSDTSSALTREYQTPKKDTVPLLSPPGTSGEQKSDRSPAITPSGSSGRAFLDIFKQSPNSDSEGRKPNKLQKKRIPGSELSSAQSSNQSLPQDLSPKSPTMTPSLVAAAATPADATNDNAAVEQGENVASPGRGLQAPLATPQRKSNDNTLRPTISPSHSFNSAMESDADMVGDDMPRENTAQPEREKRRHRWRFSRTQNKLDPSTPQASPNPLGTMTAQDQATSRSTVGSTGAPPRRSFQEPAPITQTATDPAVGAPIGSPPMQASSTDPVFSDSERDKKGGPMSWIQRKFQERKEKDVEKRSRTPERNREGGRRDSEQPTSTTEINVPVRGASIEQQGVSSSAASQTIPPPDPHAVTAAQVATMRDSTTTEPSSAATTEISPDSAGAAAPSPVVPMAADGDAQHIGEIEIEKTEGG